MKITKLLLVLSCTWFGLMPLFGQSVTITKALQLHPFASALPMYKNQFGKWEKPDLDITFPYSVIRMHLEGNVREVTQAKERLTLYMGQMTSVEDRYTENSNEILFLVPARRPSILIDCGDGCERVLLVENQNLKPNGVYDCTVYFQQSAEVLALEEEITLLKQRLAQLESAGATQEEVQEQESNKLQFTANGVSFTMIKVNGGIITLPNMGNDSIVLPDYYIGQTEVTQELWTAVMGYNPSKFPYGLKFPVETIDQDDAIEFIYRLSILTGENFYFPTRAEWTYAASGGTTPKHIYYDTEDLISSAWFNTNSVSSSHHVAWRESNRLGIYDMIGNVAEWCFDNKGYYALGGSWDSPKEDCTTLTKNKAIVTLKTSSSIGLRLVMHPKTKITDKGLQGHIVDADSSLVFQIGKEYFDMKYVEGGTFIMGHPNNKKNERPTHEVTLSDFYIGKTEVTERLWQAVMGNNRTAFFSLPKTGISYYDCLHFIIGLNIKTGKTFRLPTEAEWEYAARGGNRSNGYKYAGSHKPSEVAIYREDVQIYLLPVQQKRPNELGLYDMSGNVWEWCHDFYNLYSSHAQTNPIGHIYNKQRVLRGGGWNCHSTECQVTTRRSATPNTMNSEIGFRIVLIPDRYE